MALRLLWLLSYFFKFTIQRRKQMIQPSLHIDIVMDIETIYTIAVVIVSIIVAWAWKSKK
jgi:hypothetical protein